MCSLLLLIIVSSSHAQEHGFPYAFIDQSVRMYHATSPALLVKEITNPGQTDRQKVMALFRWVTENISYNVKRYGRHSNSSLFEEIDDDTSMVLKPLNLRVAEMVLKRGMGVCDGYARLFKTLCDYAGIPCETVTGYGRTNWGRRTKFGSNHTWNAVYFDSSWHLLDATWASGYTNYRGDEFFRRYDERYFLTPPGLFIVDHYPDDVRWTLMKEPPAQAEFNQSPYRYLGFVKMGVQSYKPSRGVIEAAPGDSIQFEVYAMNEQGLLEVVSGDKPRDTIPNDDVPVIIGGRKKRFTYHVSEQSGEWLYVICNGFVVLRYKLNIRRPGNIAVIAEN